VQVFVSVVSVLLFGLGFLISSNTRGMPFRIGWSLVSARAFALAVHGLVGLCFLLMSRGLITDVRNSRMARWRALRALLDENRIAHMCAGVWVLIASAGHVWCHLQGTYRLIPQMSLEDLNVVVAGPDLEAVPSSRDLLMTPTSISGYALVLVFAVMGILSLPWVREKCFELFYLSHWLFYSVVPLLMLHGWNGSFAYGFTNLFFWGLPCFLIYLWDIFWRRYRTSTVLTQAVIRHAAVIRCEPQTVIDGWDPAFGQRSALAEWQKKKDEEQPEKEGVDRMQTDRKEGDRIGVTKLPHASVAFLKIMRPSRLKSRAGQVVWIRCPQLSLVEFHPFSLCSSGSERDLRLMIGERQGKGKENAWCNRFIRLLAACKATQTMHADPSAIYPRIDIDGPFGAPADYSVHFQRAVFVGNVTGMAPFLGFLNSMREVMAHESRCLERSQHHEQLHAQKSVHRLRCTPKSDGTLKVHSDRVEEFRTMRRAHFVWTNRRLDELFAAFDELIFLVLCPLEIPLTFSLFITGEREKLPPEHRLLLEALEALVTKAEMVRRRIPRLGRQSERRRSEGQQSCDYSVGGHAGTGTAGSISFTPEGESRAPANGGDAVIHSETASVLRLQTGEGSVWQGMDGPSRVLDINFRRPNFDEELCKVLPENDRRENEGGEDVWKPGEDSGVSNGVHESESHGVEGPIGVFVCAGPSIQKAVRKGMQKVEKEKKTTSAKGGARSPHYVLVKEDFN